MNTILKRVILIFCLGTLVFAGQRGTKPLLDISTGELAKGETGNIQASLLRPDGRAEDITARVTWIVSPGDAVSIQNHTLTALKDGNVTLQAEYEGRRSDPVTLTIYWEVDGHRLPPEPDPKINNATLLGVDVNNNGVRDDVERWIYETYDHPIERGIFMQSARAYQKVIVDPSKAHETTKYIDDAYSCRKYWLAKIGELHNKYDYVYPTKETKKIQFNTIQRHIAYEKFNAAFSGETFSSPEANKSKCLFDDKGILKVQP